ncbi:VTT domain-containing protein [Candidatus Micrarchaeota archaeon]|nr:VTT domain-containing protein [Candidatus Micrarchaeota archaeon]MBU2476369.1 VTT domain-containing protein [Candidatus Micrarchaeota archaeon]
MDVSGLLYSLVNSYGLIGILVASLIANATLFLVVPIDAVIILVSSTGIFNPFLIALFAAVGAALGETTGYFIGKGGRHVVEKRFHDQLDKVEDLSKKVSNHGFAFIALMSFVPLFFDLISVIAGMLDYDLKKFLPAVFVGRFIRYSILAFAGKTVIEFFFGLI